MRLKLVSTWTNEITVGLGPGEYAERPAHERKWGYHCHKVFEAFLAILNASCGL